MNHTPAPPLTPRLLSEVPADRLLRSNLAAIAACDDELARKVNNACEATSIQVHASDSGWPTIQLGPLHIHSAVDPIAEAEVQAQRVPSGARRVLALGFGAGPLLAVLLRRPDLERLDVVALNAAVLHAAAATLDLRPLLCNPRLRIARLDELKAQPDLPFTVVPPLLRLADPLWAPLRDRALHTMAAESLSRQLAAQRPRWEQALSRNQGLSDAGVATVAERHRGAVAALALAGPGLSAQVRELREALGAARRRRPGSVVLLAEDAALPALTREGLLPDYLVALGLLAEPPPLLLRPLPPSVTLVYTPLLQPEVIAAWRGPRLLAWLPEHPLLAAAVAGQAERQRHALWADGATGHAVVDLGRLLGARHMVLCGAGEQPGGATLAQLAVRRGLEAYLAAHPELVIYLERNLDEDAVDCAGIAGTRQHAPPQPMAQTLDELVLAATSPEGQP